MSVVQLAIAHLHDEQQAMRAKGLYWLACDQLGDAQALAAQFLRHLPQTCPVSLICADSQPDDVFARLGADEGPLAVESYQIDSADLHPALDAFAAELQRGVRKSGSQIVLLVPALGWSKMSAGSVRRWCETVRAWLHQRGCNLLVLCHGQAPNLHESLLGLADQLAGLAQLYRQDGHIRYQLHYWQSDVGMVANQEHALEFEHGRFSLARRNRDEPMFTRLDDQRIYLIDRAALEGTAAPSEQWRLFDQRDDLLHQAAGARAATVILTIESNDQVEPLARQLHALRERCGTALKIVVREMEPCLRYRDERLLLACGVNLIVPLSTPLPHFLSLVDSVQGQVWRHGRTADFQSLFERLRPPQERGLLSPERFITTLDAVYGGASGEISHQLVRMRPRGGLAPEQYLGQISLHRFGDIACVVEGVLYLFLFACRADGRDPALGNICRMPWRELFVDCQPLDSVEMLPRQLFKSLVDVPERYRLAGERLVRQMAEAGGLAGQPAKRTTLPLARELP